MKLSGTVTPEWFEARWAEARSRVGKRYTPHLNLDLPIAEYFDSLSQNATFFRRLAELAKGFEDAKAGLRLEVAAAIVPADQARQLEQSLELVLTNLRELAELQRQAPALVPLDRIVGLVRDAENSTRIILDGFPERQDAPAHQPQSDTDRQREVLREVQYELRNVGDFLSSPVVVVCNGPHLLLLGGAGTGKTHLLCEMTRQRIEHGLPALMFLGQAFRSPFGNALEALVHSILPAADPEGFLTTLDAYARARSSRCLISVDAINEGHRQSWLQGLPCLVETFRRYPGLGLVVSCRTPFEKILVPSPQTLHLQVATHFGFPPEQQTDAIEKYFRAYGIPLPEVPLLEEEFSNPLFLKLFCEALERATIRSKHAQIRNIASGQRGMTYVLEYFVRQKGRAISDRLAIDSRLAWAFLKDHFASRLAASHTDAIPLAETTALADAVQPHGLASGEFLRALIDEDVLAEDVAFDQSTAQEVVRFTYQKFADHLIARHLLATQLDVSSSAAIKQSLRDPTKLGSYFVDHDTALNYINIIQAMMIEFPTRIKNKGELLDFLDWKSFPIRLCEAFLEGLYWREPRAINKSTVRLVMAFLGHEDLKNETLNVLLALSVKPQHPFHAGRLDAFLENQKLVARDLFWSEYLRHSIDRGTPTRILVWAEHSAPTTPSADFAKAYIKVLKWFLTSTQRGFRDRATHALFRLGRIYPEALFEETLQSLPVNDSYVPQRMLAASYGVTMALWQATTNPQFQARVLPRYARQLYKQMFIRTAKYGTTQILSRDYAQRTIQLALLVAPRLLSRVERKLIIPPFRFGGIRRWGEKGDRDEGKYREGDAPLGMDFANYTLGRLVSNRSPYDDNHVDYQQVKKQILWRIYDLGYTLEAFSQPDKEIARRSWYEEQRGRESGKTDRYGKKYAWIAFYELAGYRVDIGRLDLDERISDADIDPSFPELPESPRIFEQSWIEREGSVRDWLFSGYRPAVEDRLVLPTVRDLPGPWIVLHGHVNRDSRDKTIFAFFDGLFVPTEDVPKTIQILSSMEYPGNHNIPRPEGEYYTYAGEIPWADTWRSQQYPSSIELKGTEARVIQPVRDYSWESYHSTENQLGGVSFPSKELGEDLGLYVQIPSITTAQRNTSRVATVPIVCGKPYHDYESLLFIRQDLLDDYLRKKALRLVLFVWGERRANYLTHRDAEELEGGFKIRDVLHRQGFLYESGSFKRFL